MTKIHLVSIAPSHYCEKARWALDRAGVNYTEDKHLPLLHRIYTRNLGGTSCPKLIIGDSDDRVILQDSNDILHYADKNVNQEDWLYPAEETLLNDVSAWLTKLDQKLGPHVRRWAYFYLLYHKDSYHILSNGALLWERLAGWFLMPLLRYIIYKGIRIDAPGAKDISFRKISEIFREVRMLVATNRGSPKSNGRDPENSARNARRKTYNKTLSKSSQGGDWAGAQSHITAYMHGE